VNAAEACSCSNVADVGPIVKYSHLAASRATVVEENSYG
jgi:hypothetical protein